MYDISLDQSSRKWSNLARFTLCSWLQRQDLGVFLMFLCKGGCGPIECLRYLRDTIWNVCCAPFTILSDQFLAMCAALLEVLPAIAHHWCKWQALKKATKMLGHIFKEYKSQISRMTLTKC
ncbi:hypothetical protein ACP4OV_029260 [Aristida adscensionis]